MGQAFRRATGSVIKPSVDKRTPVAPSKSKVEASSSRHSESVGFDSGASHQEVNADNLLEERDPKFDVMLNQMVGRITSKQGKLETGGASVVKNYNRPMPKLRNTTPDSSRYEERPTPPGTLNVAQVRQIMCLYQGKADDHNGAMDVEEIATKFRVDVMQIRKILQSISLPDEDKTKKENFE